MYRFLHANILLSGTFLIAAMVGCSSSTETATNTGTSTGQTQAGSSDASGPSPSEVAAAGGGKAAVKAAAQEHGMSAAEVKAKVSDMVKKTKGK